MSMPKEFASTSRLLVTMQTWANTKLEVQIRRTLLQSIEAKQTEAADYAAQEQSRMQDQISQMHVKFVQLSSEVTSDVKGVRANVCTLTNDVKGVQANVGALTSDVKGVQSNVKALTQNVDE